MQSILDHAHQVIVMGDIIMRFAGLISQTIGTNPHGCVDPVLP